MNLRGADFVFSETNRAICARSHREVVLGVLGDVRCVVHPSQEVHGVSVVHSGAERRGGLGRGNGGADTVAGAADKAADGDNGDGGNDDAAERAASHFQ